VGRRAGILMVALAAPGPEYWAVKTRCISDFGESSLSDLRLRLIVTIGLVVGAALAWLARSRRLLHCADLLGVWTVPL
jgi:hypothetical protein